MSSHSYNTSVLIWRSLPFTRALGCMESIVFVLSAKKLAAPSLPVTESSHLAEVQAPRTSLILMNKWRISYSVSTISVSLKEHKHKLCHRQCMLHTLTISHTISLNMDNSPPQPHRSKTTLQQACKLLVTGTHHKQWVTSNFPRLPPRIFNTHSSQRLVPTSGRLPVLRTITHHRRRELSNSSEADHSIIVISLGPGHGLMAHIPACEFLPFLLSCTCQFVSIIVRYPVRAPGRFDPV